MRWLPLVFLAACTDFFVLPVSDGDAGVSDHGDDGGAGDAREDGSTGADAGADGDAGPLLLPAACATLLCTPASNEGDVFLKSGNLSGCHAYQTLTIGSLGNVTATRDASGVGFVACAETINIGGGLTASSQGDSSGSGAGPGGTCGSGGGHGGAGGDPGACGGGMIYDDPNAPRLFGSGGGGLPTGAGGSGGGVIELAATQITLLGFIFADGGSGTGASAGGGSGGSVILRANSIQGAGKIYVRGGAGVGLSGGGGGGGRIAIRSANIDANLSADVKGGSAMAGGGSGSDGTIVRMP